jgi:hypothetical protein
VDIAAVTNVDRDKWLLNAQSFFVAATESNIVRRTQYSPPFGTLSRQQLRS